VGGLGTEPAVTNRVLVDASPAALKASLPGVNVLTATLSQLAFTGIGNTLFVFARGIVNFNATDAGGGEVAGEGTYTYPVTAPERPLCFFNYQSGAGVGGNLALSPQLWVRSGADAVGSAEVSTTAVTFRFRAGSAGTLAVRVRFILLLPK
jgi:hypothetical protein